jgi:hypothetical protein
LFLADDGDDDSTLLDTYALEVGVRSVRVVGDALLSSNELLVHFQAGPVGHCNKLVLLAEEDAVLLHLAYAASQGSFELACGM